MQEFKYIVMQHKNGDTDHARLESLHDQEDDAVKHATVLAIQFPGRVYSVCKRIGDATVPAKPVTIYKKLW